MSSFQPGPWRFCSGVIQSILYLAVLSSCGRRASSSNAASLDIGFGGEPWVAVENAAFAMKLDWKKPLLYAANGFLWWSLGHGNTRRVELASGRQSNLGPMDIKAMDGGEGFATVRVDLGLGDTTEIVAVDLASGRRRRVAYIVGYGEEDWELLQSPLALDATYVYFLRSPGLFRVRRDGGGRPESLASLPSHETKALAVEGGYVYWSQVNY
ncbi:MAG TPA: hypothetical protein VF550_03395, partial [Polyangia bacterium]